MRKALRENLVYLIKAEQLFQIKTEGKTHTFGMSSVPNKIKRGRPRGVIYLAIQGTLST